MRTRLPALLLALSLTVPAAWAQSATSPNPRDALRLLDLWFDAQRAFDRVPGISAGVVIDQQLVWAKGYGFADEPRAVRAAPDTVYSICSISKLFTSIAVMQLWEAGKLALDDDVARHLPEFAIQRSDADSGPISIRSLLTHSSGLPREGDLPYWSDIAFPDRAALLQRLREQRTFARANERFQYSNLGMALLGEVVAAVSGMPYEQYVQQRILAPLAMADTVPRLPQALAGQRLAVGHGALDRDGRRRPMPPYEPRALVAAMGYSSTVNDLARLAMWQLRLLDKGGSELLKVATLREMHRVQWQDADGANERGLGFAIARDGSTTIAGHDGLCPGFRSAVYVMPTDKLGVIGMANAVGNTGLLPYTRQIRRLVQKGLKLVPAKNAALLEPYTGRYDEWWTSEEVIVPWGENLAMLNLPHSDPGEGLSVIKHEQGDTFRLLRSDGSLGAPVIFQRDAAGRITGYKLNGQLAVRVGPLP